MKRLIYTTFSITLFSIVLTGCNWNNTVDESKATYINTGVGYRFIPVNTVEGVVPSHDMVVY